MIQQQTILKVADNSGAKTVKCIKVLGGFKKRFAKIGDLIVVAIQQLRNKSKITTKVQKGEIYKALIIRTKTKNKRKDSISMFFNNNYVSLMNNQNNPIGTKIIGPISRHLKRTKYQKFISISAGLF